MAATTTLLGLLTPTQGTLSGTWGDSVNYGISDYVDISVAGTLTLTNDGAVTLANTTGSSSGNSITSSLTGAGTVTAQFAMVRVSGTTVAKTVTGPSYSKSYIIDNASSFSVTFKASGQTGVSISPGEKVGVYYNGTDYVKIGGGGITYGAVKTTTYTAVANDGVLTNTTGGAFTVNLPATPATGTQVFIADSAGTWATNNLTIGRNGSTIAGSATDLVCDINSVSIQCIYDGTTWDIFAQIGANDTAVVTLNGTQTLTNKTLTSPTITGTGAIAAATVTLSSTLSVTGVSTLTGGALVGGNLGVGIAIPQARLNVQYADSAPTASGTISSGAVFQYAAGGVALNMGSSSGGYVYFNSAFANNAAVGQAYRFYQGATQAMTLGASGNLLVGTTNDSGSRLSLAIASATYPSVQAQNDFAGSSGLNTFYSSLGDGTNSVSNTNCYHLKAISQGSAIYYLYGNGTTSFTSDARLKKNITTARDGYTEDLCKLRVVKYNWNNAPEGEAQELGLIAQEVEQVFPGLVQDAVDEVQGIKPKVLKASVLPFILLKAIQEQQAVIESLKARLDAANL